MSLSGSFIVYSVKCNASVLLMFILSLGPGDYINMSLSGPLIVYSVVTIIQSHFFFGPGDYISMSLSGLIIVRAFKH